MIVAFCDHRLEPGKLCEPTEIQLADTLVGLVNCPFDVEVTALKDAVGVGKLSVKD